MSERAPLVVVVSAPSGAGKSTIVARVRRELPGIRFSVSHTTRPPRRDEQEGVDYHFVDRSAFEKLRSSGQLLESAEVHGNLYGTALAEIERAKTERCDVLLDVDVQGADQVRAKIGDAVTVFILPPSFADLERRLRGRDQDDEATIRRRLAVAGAEISAFARFDYAIVNDAIDDCVETLKCIIRASRFRVAQVAPRARAIERTFLTREETKTV